MGAGCDLGRVAAKGDEEGKGQGEAKDKAALSERVPLLLSEANRMEALCARL